jgi:hypothetical protein
VQKALKASGFCVRNIVRGDGSFFLIDIIPPLRISGGVDAQSCHQRCVGEELEFMQEISVLLLPLMLRRAPNRRPQNSANVLPFNFKLLKLDCKLILLHA